MLPPFGTHRILGTFANLANLRILEPTDGHRASSRAVGPFVRLFNWIAPSRKKACLQTMAEGRDWHLFRGGMTLVTFGFSNAPLQ